MIGIEVELLTGRYVATSHSDRRQPEWPPHPARLFSALVAAWAEGDRGEATGEALDWLAACGAPEILASGAEARVGSVVYVPGNGEPLLKRSYARWLELDDAEERLVFAQALGTRREVRQAESAVRAVAKKCLYELARETRAVGEDEVVGTSTIRDAVGHLPWRRDRQPRHFPSVRPEVARVCFVWPDAEPEASVRAGLARVLGQVSRLGHSSSLVACRGVDETVPPDATGRARWVPDERGDTVLRVCGAGQRARLLDAHEVHQGVEPRVLPCRFQPYQREGAVEEGAAAATSVFDPDWIVFREVADGAKGRRKGVRLSRAADLARALRGALLRYSDDPPEPFLSGHHADGSPLTTPHLAFVPLGDVGTTWSTGAVLGMAVVSPREVGAGQREALLRAIGRWEADGGGEPLRLVLGRAGELLLERVVEVEPRATLRASTWCRPARRWASVTPVALDRNPGMLSAGDPEVVARAVEAAREIVRRACERIGLPRPVAVELPRDGLWVGSPPARAFMPFPIKSGAVRRVCVHVELVFDRPVRGPLLIGAGRYQGLGLLRPLPDAGAWP